MCGIAVVVSRKRESVAAALQSLCGAMSHRGPDDQGRAEIELDGVFLGLGHRRLSILDLSPLGHQPMQHPESGDLLIYNGELYNFLDLRRELEQSGVNFRGRSDTEVMLHALVRSGPEVIARFRGMFALAWFRRKQRSLVVARDPLGIKPMYMWRCKGEFAIASEVRALVASGLFAPSVSKRGAAQMLAYGAVQDPDTIIEGVSSFPSGCWQEIPLDPASRSQAQSMPVRYWHPPPIRHSMTEAQSIEITRETLDRSVMRHLVSDVPLGVFLSSGIDSTIIAGIASRHSTDIRTYTVSFEDHPDLSEESLAAKTAERLGMPHIAVPLPSGDAEQQVEEWLDDLDQPSVDGLNTYVVSGAVKRAGLTVALSGLGGDELYCGYSTFTDVPRLQSIMRSARFLSPSKRMAMARLASLGRSTAYREKLTEIAMTSGTLLELYLQRRRLMSGQQLADLGLDAEALDLDTAFMSSGALEGLSLPDTDNTAALSILEARYYAGNMLLRDSDTNGMAHSLEIRVPFFDTDVVDAAMSIPSHLRMPAGRPNKHLLRTAFSGFFTPEMLVQRKLGFTLPIRRWMVGSLKGLCDESLAHLKRSGLIDPRGIDRVYQAFQAQPETAIWSRAFSLCVLGSYIKRMKDLQDAPRLAARAMNHSH